MMLRSVRSLLFLAPLLALLVPALMPATSRALPLFARQYAMPCTGCHYAFPRLNAFGMKFRQNGYRLEGQPGQSPWENKEFPLSLVGNVGVAYTRTNVEDPLNAPQRLKTAESGFRQNAVEFHTAGTLAERVTFHFDNGFANDTGVLESGMAFVQLDDVAKGGALNIKAGIFDAEIPYLADSRKTTQNGYLSPVTLDARGFELNGTKSTWSYAIGLINSDRDPANAKPGTKTFNRLENVYAWLMRDLSGQLVTVRVFLDRQDPRVVTATTSQHLQVEGSAFLNSGRFVVIPGFTYEKFDDLPATGVSEKHETGLLEALALLGKDQRWLISGRVEIQHIPTTTASSSENHTLSSLNLSYFVNPNAKLGLEWAHTSDNIAGPKVDELQAYAHVGY